MLCRLVFRRPCAKGGSSGTPSTSAKLGQFQFCAGTRKYGRVVNDAAMQALGSYPGGGRMLFLGLGTGSDPRWSGTESDVPRVRRPSISERKDHREDLGIPGLEKFEQEKIAAQTRSPLCSQQLKRAFIADYVVLGGGLVHRFGRLPKGIVRGQNGKCIPRRPPFVGNEKEFARSEMAIVVDR